MRQSMGSAFTLNLIIIFMVFVFGILSAILGYTKAYKASSLVAKSIEKYEGYNSLSKEEITLNLGSIGYLVRTKGSCPQTKTIKLTTGSMTGIHETLGRELYDYCVYYFDKDYETGSDKYYSYGIITYIYWELPLIGVVKIPVFTKTDRIYKFN